MKEINQKILKTAITKIHIEDRSQDRWYGCLTPSEILELIKAGAKASKTGYPTKEYVEECYTSGDSKNIMFRFFASKLPIPNYKREIEKAFGRKKKNG